ncbi:protein of unknown function [Taphrina deformans PYCC 5710]|uniref:Peptide hydrolase n=1 Tax=Taphrina deformans (strain PYCC 5710 / ATCC 11124 / CBS 356.35 / IMI 108563 / JCM 9778 / NBRC 8474) TaxID=1097556 RepID=R4XD23_TAPDE|nr:protein of unknown function [Taphrina deformans PYCC 5710]|eukprot:CCG82308.1 protein of unknown function [Taphrina deformans PYCC 5710]
MVLSFLLAATLAGVSAQRYVNESAFANLATFQAHTDMIGQLGLRSTGSVRQHQLVEYIDRYLQAVPDVSLDYTYFDLFRWQTNNDYTLFEAGKLALQMGDGSSTDVPIAGVIPLSHPAPIPVVGQLVYYPASTNLSTVNLTGKVVLRDFDYQSHSLSYALVNFLAYYTTPDTASLINSSVPYERPYLGDINQDLFDAGSSGAVGYISMWDVPRQSVQSYFDPHQGTHYTLPAHYVGSIEAQELKLAALSNTSVSMSVAASADTAMTKEIQATLPGMTNDTVYVITHTDGNTWVQDDGVAAALAIIEYFAAQPMSTRNKTLKFAFNSGHLSYSREGNLALARSLNSTYDTDGTSLVIALEHMGTREITASNRTDGQPGRELKFSGLGEPMLWSVGPIQVVIDAIKSIIQYRKLDRVFLAKGLSAPSSTGVPAIASQGGIGTLYHEHLLPTTSIISGPWSLWAPSFQASALNLTRLRDQTLAFADLILSVDGYSKAQLAGNYTIDRQRLASGKATSNSPSTADTPSEFAPGYFTSKQNY